MATRPRQAQRRAGRLGVQLIASALLVLSLGLLLSSSHTLSSEEDLLSGQLDVRGASLAQLGAVSCGELILSGDHERVQRILRAIPDRDPAVVYARAEAADGTTILEVHRGDPAGPAAVGSSRQYFADAYAAPDAAGGGPVTRAGRITIGLSVASLEELEAERTRILALEAGVSFLGIGLVLSFLLRRRVVRPLEVLDRQAAALGRGDLETPVFASSDNEIGRLARTLDAMRLNLRASYSEVRANNADLVELGHEKDRALAALAKALDAANAANRSKDEFLSTMSHELRTPMNGILGMTQVLLQTPLDAEQRDAAETVRGAAEVLLDLVNDLLDYSMLNAGQVVLAPVVVDPRAILHDVLAGFRSAAEGKGLTLDAHVDELVPRRIRADPVRLRQILSNLVGNAIKFTARGGVEVRIRVEAFRHQRVELRFTVADTGEGIPVASQGRIFQPFTQGDGSIRRRHGGTGLGLVLARRLVDMMSGRIGLESEPGRGSAFWFTAVLERAPEGAPSVSRAAGRVRHGEPRAPLPTAATGRPLRVLLVEDNPVNQKVALKMLGRLGCVVDVAENGAVAVERFANASYALVLMDLSMPVMDGLEATRRMRLREARTGARVPIVALTANAMAGDRERCLAAGMDDYLTKPIRADGLAEIIGRFAPVVRSPGS